MGEPLENMYFNWLSAKVINPLDTDQEVTYWDLLIKLHKTEFVWVISGDDNRAEDGKELRRDFILAADAPDDPDWRLALGCSVLEMFIAFAKRAEYQEETPASEWFWEFIDNLRLNRYSDQEGFDDEEVQIILDLLIWRQYSANGDGGMFPIRRDLGDQTQVEIWYQFCNYLVDNNRLV